MTADWLAHDRDLALDELERLAYAGIATVLSSVRASHQGGHSARRRRAGGRYRVLRLKLVGYIRVVR